MDFFARQDAARRATRRLIAFFALAVIVMVLVLYLVTAFVLMKKPSSPQWQGPAHVLLRPQLALTVTVTTLLVIAAGSLYKIVSLRDGGASVARLLGGRPMSPNTEEPSERQLLNVVEEMAIASGSPVPTVYLLENEEAINAFAAGFSPSDAVIGVSAGCLARLSRDELQGVIAHEFSHIVNGDMRLNLRLIGLLHGILVISMIGYFIMRYAGRGGRNRGAAPLALFGVALYIVGYAGVFCGRLIKSSISRQREYLADASGVQFTRNPLGLAGALSKIGGFLKGSRLQTPRAEEASHLYFANGLRQGFFSWFATHPPLAARILRLDPTFSGRFPEVLDEDISGIPGSLASALAPTTTHHEPQTRAETADHPAAITQRVGDLNDEYLAYATQLLKRIPTELRERVHEPSTARAVVFALLLDPRPPIRQVQLEALRAETDSSTWEETLTVLATLDGCSVEARLPLIDLALPALRRLSTSQYETFQEHVRRLITADQRIGLFEYTLQSILLRHLAPSFQPIPRASLSYYSLNTVQPEIAVLLSIVAHLGHQDPTVTQEAFAAGSKSLPFQPQLIGSNQLSLRLFDQALKKLSRSTPSAKRRLVQAITATVAFDGTVSVKEGELLRAIADRLDCPVPPFLPGQKLAA